MDNYKHEHRDFRRQKITTDGFLGAPNRENRNPRIRTHQTHPQKPALNQRPRLVQRHRIDSHPIDVVRHIPKKSPSRPITRSLPALDLTLPAAASPLKTGRKLVKGKRIDKWSYKTATACLVILVALFAVGYLKFHGMFGGGANPVGLQTNVDPSLLKGEGDGRVNILLLGRGGNGHDAPDLTDTIMIASIDPVNNKAVLLSVPRDLWVNIPNYGPTKINAAYETGKYRYLGRINPANQDKRAIEAGFSLADQTVEKTLGIPIHYNALIDFQAFENAINTVGGVKVKVPREVWDPTVAWANNWNPIVAKPGVQTFNGAQALLYVRSRETTSDFSRAQRQRLVLMALKNKIESLGTLSNPLKVTQLMDAFSKGVQTDLSLSDLIRLHSLLEKIINQHVKSLDLTNGYVTTADIGGQSVVEPTAGEYSFGQIQKYVRHVLPDGYIVRENAQVTVLNGTKDPGLALGEAEVLKSYGYKVKKVGDAPVSNLKRTVLIDLTHGQKKYTKHYLERRFDVHAIDKAPDNIHPGGADFIIVLGSNAIVHN